MSNYLDHLLAKSTNTGEVIQPRPVSAFEPLPGIPRPGFEVGEDQALLDNGLPAPNPTQAPSPYPPLPGLEPARPAGWRAGLSAGPPWAEQPAAPSMRRPASPQPEPPSEERPAVPWTSRPASPQPEPLPIQPGQNPAALEFLIGSRTVLPPQPARPAAPLPLQAEAAAAGAEGSAPYPAAARFTQPVSPVVPRPTVGQKVGQSTVRPVVAPVSQIVPAVIPAASPWGPAEPANGAAPSEPVRPLPVVTRPRVRVYGETPTTTGATPAARPEPTIQVTIGRIEVRATPAAAIPPKKQAPAAPMMNLEEYRRQRKGGAR